MATIRVMFNEFEGDEVVEITVPDKMSHRFGDIVSLGMLHAEFWGKVTVYDELNRAEVIATVRDGKIGYNP